MKFNINTGIVKWFNAEKGNRGEQAINVIKI